MRFSLSCMTRFLLVLLCVSLFAGSVPPKIKAQKQESQSSAVVFAVFTRGLPDTIIEPILIIDGGSYKEPIAGDSNAEELSKFAADHYRKGQKYRMLFGGGDAGSLTVKESTKDSDCLRAGASVDLQSSAKLNTNVMALATNSDSLGRAKSSRRAPTASERAAVVPLARNAYRQNGVPVTLLQGMQTVNLTATDLNNDGKTELIGSFLVKKRKGGEERYVLFMLAEPQGNGYKVALTQYDRITEKNIMDGGSIDSIGTDGLAIERLVDQLDLDNDGTAEVVTTTGSFEGVSYRIYRKQQGQWQKLYEFASYRCAF